MLPAAGTQGNPRWKGAKKPPSKFSVAVPHETGVKQDSKDLSLPQTDDLDKDWGLSEIG